MPETDERLVALHSIAVILERLVKEADAHRLSLLAYLLEMAASEAHEELANQPDSKIKKLRPRR